MSESKEKNEFARNLLAQDPPAPDKQSQQNQLLFKKFKRHIRLGKIIGGAIYIALFLTAFSAFMQHQYNDDPVHAICWAAVSLHIMLWFLVYFLRCIYRTLAEIMDENAGLDQKHAWRKEDRFVTIVAIVVFAFTSVLLYRSFFSSDPSEVADLPAHNFWAAVFFLFYYPFATASLLAKLWLKYKQMELNITETEK
ncbi:MAG: hypothetical protein ACYS4W_07595 [Planctomycetota bacterium]|jgi:hypothetical protein